MQSDSESKIRISFFQLDIWRGRITIILSNSGFSFFPKWEKEVFVVIGMNCSVWCKMKTFCFFKMQRQWKQTSENCEWSACDSFLPRMQKKASASRDLIRCNPCIQDVLLHRFLAYFESDCLARWYSFIFWEIMS